MSVRQSILALLAQGPRHGALIKSEFEALTGGPLNVGQVYTTLARLERDALVGSGAPDDEGRIAYHLTDAGREHVRQWWIEPVDRDDPGRDELLIKLALALGEPEVDALAVIQAQRTATMQMLQQLTRRKLTLDAQSPVQSTPVSPAPDGDAPGGSGNGADAGLGRRLVLEHRLFTVEAELRWLDHIEALITRHPAAAPAHPTAHVPTAREGGQPRPTPPAPTTGAKR